MESDWEPEVDEETPELELEVPVPVVAEPELDAADAVPELLAAATPPNATTAARLARAVPMVSLRTRSTALSRSRGVRRCALVMPGSLAGQPFASVTDLLLEWRASRTWACYAAWRSSRWRSRAACWRRASVSRSTPRRPAFRSETWPACHSAAKTERSSWYADPMAVIGVEPDCG